LKKIFVLDTNVLLSDYKSIFKFEDNTIHIPLVVLRELDKFKREAGDRGYNSRQVARYLDKLCKRGKLNKGVKLNNGGRLFVSMTKSLEKSSFRSNDEEIIYYTKSINGILVTQDINMRLQARAMGLEAQDYEPGELRNIDTNYTGNSELVITSYNVKELQATKIIDMEGKSHKLFDNEYVLLKLDVSKWSRLGKYKKKDNAIHLVKEYTKGICGIKGKNKEQRYLLDALLDPEIKLVTILGQAGTGKTLLAVAAGLQQVIEDETYSRVMVARPVIPMGRDLGYLPGSLSEKLDPWMQPIYDNVDFILDNSKVIGKFSNSRELVSREILSVEPLMYIRGRSIANQYMIIDEAQNLTPHEVKTIITRVGEGTKIVLTGDIQQIDSNQLDQRSNGLVYVMNKFKTQDMSAHITLVKGERSALAKLAAKIL